MKYVISGGAGFIGSHLAEALCLEHEVIILDNLFSGNYKNFAEFINNITFVKGSVTDLGLLNKIFRDVDGVFHEAAIASVPGSLKNPIATNETNINGTLNVLVAAKNCGVNKVIYASSAAVYGDEPTLPKRENLIVHPQSPYAVSKLAGEYYCDVFSNLYDIQTVSLRYFNVFGPRQDPKSEYAAVIPRFISRLMSGKAPMIFGDGKQTRDFIFVKDVVKANIQAMESDAQGVYNIASGNETSINQLASILMKLFGMDGSPLYEPVRNGDVYRSYADISLAKNSFKFVPSIALEEGLQETISFFSPD